MNKPTEDGLISDYRVYVDSSRPYAEEYAREHIPDNEGYWVAIPALIPYHHGAAYREFRRVDCVLYPKRTKPVLPSRDEYIFNGEFDEVSYRKNVQFQTWKAMTEDIKACIAEKYKPQRYSVFGGEGYHIRVLLIENTPQEIRDKLAKIDDTAFRNFADKHVEAVFENHRLALRKRGAIWGDNRWRTERNLEIHRAMKRYVVLCGIPEEYVEYWTCFEFWFMSGNKKPPKQRKGRSDDKGG